MLRVACCIWFWCLLVAVDCWLLDVCRVGLSVVRCLLYGLFDVCGLFVVRCSMLVVCCCSLPAVVCLVDCCVLFVVVGVCVVFVVSCVLRAACCSMVVVRCFC